MAGGPLRVSNTLRIKFAFEKTLRVIRGLRVSSFSFDAQFGTPAPWTFTSGAFVTIQEEFGHSQNFGRIHRVVRVVLKGHFGKFPKNGTSHTKRLRSLLGPIEIDAFIRIGSCLSCIENNAILALCARIKHFTEIRLLLKHGKVLLVQFFTFMRTRCIESKQKIDIATNFRRCIFNVLHRINVKEPKMTSILKNFINVLRLHHLFLFGARAGRFGHTIVHHKPETKGFAIGDTSFLPFEKMMQLGFIKGMLDKSGRHKKFQIVITHFTGIHSNHEIQLVLDVLHEIPR